MNKIYYLWIGCYFWYKGLVFFFVTNHGLCRRLNQRQWNLSIPSNSFNPLLPPSFISQPSQIYSSFSKQAAPTKQNHHSFHQQINSHICTHHTNWSIKKCWLLASWIEKKTIYMHIYIDKYFSSHCILSQGNISLFSHYISDQTTV